MITLTNPISLCPQAYKIDVVSVNLSTSECKVVYQWLEQSNAVIRTDSIIITGVDLQDILTARATAGDAGTRLSILLWRTIKQKLIAILGVSGTVS